MNDSASARHIFQEGDHALVIDRRGRRYLAHLRSGAKFESHLGAFPHDDLIGAEPGSWMTTNRGHVLLAVTPTMSDFGLEMPRIATVSYPKDLGTILVYGDIFPGARVLEAGCGSGAMTMTLLRAIGEQGSLVSYDLRQDMIDRTRENITAMIPDTSNLTLKLGNVYEGIEEKELDRIVLDLPEPWRVVPHASESLLLGGIFVSFSPTVMQIHELTNALRIAHTFEMMETMEVLQRPWAVGARSVRPEHRMIAHTGFITIARRCKPRPPSSVGGRD